METCPHGARIAVSTDTPVVFIDPCDACQGLLRELGFELKSTTVPRETVTAA